MGGSDEIADIPELKSRVRQLENAAREAHVHLRNGLAEQEARWEAQQDELAELQDELSDARQHIRRSERYLTALRDQDSN